MAATTAFHRSKLRVTGRVDSTPPELYFVVSAVFHYLGPSFAVLLFARVEPIGVAWLRIVSAAVVFAIWRRPWKPMRTCGRRIWALVCALGVVLALMNACFYVAIDRLPLGTVAAIEFVPVIALAAIGARSTRNVIALASSVVGVYALIDVHLGGERLGVAFALANALLFASYIVLAHRISREHLLAPIDGLAAAMLIAAAAITPIGGLAAAPGLLDATAIAAGIGIGICSSVIPYVSDQLAMRRMARSTYALAISILPATATIIGVVVLSQIPSATDLLGIGLVILAIVIHRERDGPT